MCFTGLWVLTNVCCLVSIRTVSYEWFLCPKTPLCPTLHPYLLSPTLGSPWSFYSLGSVAFSSYQIVGIIRSAAFSHKLLSKL